MLAIAVAVAALTFVGAPVAHGFAPFAMWGSTGALPGQFDVADGVDVDARGNVYVVDRENHRVQRFSSTGRLLGVIGGVRGAADGQLAQPYGVAVDEFGAVYVADTRNNRIQKFGPDGRFLTKFGRNGGDGTAGTGRGEFRDPRDVEVDARGNIWVGDHDNHRIQKLSPTGRFLGVWGRNGGDGSSGVGNGEFNQPRGIAVDAAGGFYVVEKTNNRVPQFDARGRVVRRWGHNGGDGTPGLADGELNFPYNVAIDGAGDLYVTDTLNHRVQKYTPDGRYLAKWGRNGGDGSLGDRLGEFHEPYGIAADCTGNVYVSEEGNNRVQKLGEPGRVTPRCPPALDVALRGAQRAASRGGVVVRVACDQPCTAAVTVSIGGARETSAGHELLPRDTKRVRVALSRARVRAIARALRAGRRVRARVTVTATGFAGSARAVRRTVRVAR